MKSLETLGQKERAIVEERRRSGWRAGLTHVRGELEPHLRAAVERLLPGVAAEVDVAAFVDANADNPLGRGNRAPNVPAPLDLLLAGLEALADRGFSGLSEADQDALIGRMRRGEADAELGLPAKEFVDRLLRLALAGYLAHPDAWERIGFNGPAYPDGYAWISRSAVKRRHEDFVGAGRL